MLTQLCADQEGVRHDTVRACAYDVATQACTEADGPNSLAANTYLKPSIGDQEDTSSDTAGPVGLQLQINPGETCVPAFSTAPALPLVGAPAGSVSSSVEVSTDTPNTFLFLHFFNSFSIVLTRIDLQPTVWMMNDGCFIYD